MCQNIAKENSLYKMYFAVVTFIETQDVAVAPLNWINCDECLWPPKQLRSKVLSQVQKEITIEASAEWDSYPVKIMGTFDSYAEARAKLALATEKSDLNSTDQEDLGKNMRTKRKNRRKTSTSSTESEDLCAKLQPTPTFKPPRKKPCSSTRQKESQDNLIHLQDPQTFQQKIDTENGSIEKDVCDDSLTLSTQNVQDVVLQYVPCDVSFTLSTDPNDGNILNVIPDTYHQSFLTSTPRADNGNIKCSVIPDTYNQAFLTSTPRVDNGNITCSESQTASSNIHIRNESNTSGSKTCGSLLNEDIGMQNISSKKKGSLSLSGTIGFETAVLRDINIIKMNQRSILEQLDSISVYLNKQQKVVGENPNNPNLSKDIMSLIPVTNVVELGKLESKLKDENISNQMIQFLSKLGGNSCEQATKIMMRKVISDDLAILFSFQGIREKKSFRSLEIYKRILCKHE